MFDDEVNPDAAAGADLPDAAASADLPRADLPSADLPSADLPSADLDGADLDGIEASLAWAAAGVPSWQSVRTVTSVAPAQLSDTAQIDGLVVLERHIAWLQGIQQQFLHTLAQDSAAADPEVAGKQWIREEVACALKVSSPVARERIALAARLSTQLPATLHALQEGAISFWYAKHLSDSVEILTADRAAAVEESVLVKAGGQTFAEFSRALKIAVIRADPAAAAKGHALAVADRDVRKVPLPDGIAAIWAPMSADQAELVMAGLTAAANATEPTSTDNDGTCSPEGPTGSPSACTRADHDHRTLGQRRVDALVDLCTVPLVPPNTVPSPSTAVPAPSTEPGLSRRALRRATKRAGDRTRPCINVTIALSTLLELGDQPAELEGHGPIPATLARRIAGDPNGTWRRLITDPAGHLIDYGRKKYRPPTDLANHVINRDQLCTFPGCRRNARVCDLDHTRDWDHGGCTNERNLAALCPRHHHAKHDAGWTPRCDPDNLNTNIWTSPTGHIYRSTPPPLPTPQPKGRGRLSTDLVIDPDDPPPF